MALRRKVTKEAYEKLTDEIKKEYVLKDGAYVLDTDDDEDFDALKNSVTTERQKRKDAEKKLRDLEDEAETERNNANKKNGDVAALEASWQKKLDTAKAEADAAAAKLNGAISKLLADGTARDLANALSTVPSVMAKVIRERLTVDMSGDEPALRVLDANGKPSAMSVDDLKKEIASNKEFAAIIKASNGSGGGATNGGADKLPPLGGGAARNDPSKPAPTLAQMKPSDLAAAITARKATV